MPITEGVVVYIPLSPGIEHILFQIGHVFKSSVVIVTYLTKVAEIIVQPSVVNLIQGEFWRIIFHFTERLTMVVESPKLHPWTQLHELLLCVFMERTVIILTMVGAKESLFGHLPIFEPVLDKDVINPGYHRVDDKVFILVKGVGGLYP